MDSVEIPGTVRSVKRRKDPVEHLEIHVKKEGDQRFLNREDKMRVPVPLSIGSQEYIGGIRSTRDCPYIWVSPDLMGKAGQKVSLVDALNSAGLKKNDKVIIRVEKWKISIIPTNPPI